MLQGSIMENENIIDSNPNMIGLYLEALKQKESSGDYQVLHNPSIITDVNTGKPIRVQALGAYGILDINWNKWSKEAGLEKLLTISTTLDSFETIHRRVRDC